MEIDLYIRKRISRHEKKAYTHAHMPPQGYNPYFRLVDDYVYIVLNSFHL